MPPHKMPGLDRAPQSRQDSTQVVRAARLESMSQLAGSVAHDLNNALTAIIGYGTLLTERIADDAEALSDAREVLVAAERAATLSRQLLAFSRRQVLVPTRLHLNELFDAVRPRLLESIGKRVTLELQADEGIPAISIDGGRLQEALVALASNASDAMPDGGRLRLRASLVGVDAAYAADRLQVEAGSYVRVTVSDTGCGVARDLQDRVFEPFFTTKGRGKGEGLGLSTVHGFVRQSRGGICLDSEERGGTTVSMFFPVAVAVPPQVVAEPAVRPVTGQTVLLVDDTDAVRRQVADVLRRGGYRVIVANGASEALYMAGSQRGPIHLLLTDVIMPGSSGVDLARELRTDRPGLRVLYMSGFGGHEVVQHGVIRTGESFIEKPFSRDALLQKVATLLR